MNNFKQPAKIHNRLNPVLWKQGRLQKDVHVALLKIAKAYYKFLSIDTPIIDIVSIWNHIKVFHSELT